MPRALLWAPGCAAEPNVGLLAARPVAGEAVWGLVYFATDVGSGTAYQCVETVAGTFAWLRLGTSSSGTTLVRSVPGVPYALATAWTTGATSILTNVTSGASLQTQIGPDLVPSGATLVSITAFLTGAAGHAAFPGGAPTMPKVSRSIVTRATGISSTAVGTSDTSATAGAFETYHSVTFPDGATVLDHDTKNYFCTFTAEAGANFVAGDVFSGFVVAYTLP